jgi:hypothetical protein
MAIFQVQEENQQKVLVPLTDTTPVDEVTAGNMQSVTSNAVSESLSYSETETLTGGTWIDGKPIYRKVINFGALPNNTIKGKSHNITNLKNFVSIRGIAMGGDYFPIPYVATSSLGAGAQIYVNSTQIAIQTGSDRTAYTGYVILEYTKTT